MKLLIIEDEEDLLEALSRGLHKLGYSVDTTVDGKEGLDLAKSGTYDLIILDLNLPGMDGMDILDNIRKADWEQKVLILSARSAFRQRVEGLDKGANDYLIKPFDFEELRARIHNLLRRQFVQQEPVLACETLRLNTQSREVTGNGGVPISLSPKEFAILEYLLIQKGRPVSAEELIGHAWAEEETDLFSNAVKVHISLLRRKLEAAGCGNILETIRCVGYRIGKGEDHA